MLLFGVTGGIGSGKSTVCSLLKSENIPVLEADPLAKVLTASLPEIKAQLIERFGPDTYTAGGDLNKQKLGELVFSNPATREEINAIIHPHVLSRIKALARDLEKQGHTLVAVEAALIYEAGMEEMLDAIVVVTAPLERRLEWLSQRDKLPVETLRQRMKAQMPESEKVRRADFVIENSGDREALKAKVAELITWLRQR